MEKGLNLLGGKAESYYNGKIKRPLEFNFENRHGNWIPFFGKCVLVVLVTLERGEVWHIPQRVL